MIVLIALDENGGMCFHGRRQSRDKLLCARILSLAEGETLRMNAYSAPLFAGESAVKVSEAFLSEAAEGDFCFVETAPLAAYADKIEKIIVYRWNRAYPADFFPDIDLSAWKRLSSAEFAGSSHPIITEEIYIK